jgi:hypothetical protein
LPASRVRRRGRVAPFNDQYEVVITLSATHCCCPVVRLF